MFIIVVFCVQLLCCVLHARLEHNILDVDRYLCCVRWRHYHRVVV